MVLNSLGLKGKKRFLGLKYWFILVYLFGFFCGISDCFAQYQMTNTDFTGKWYKIPTNKKRPCNDSLSYIEFFNNSTLIKKHYYSTNCLVISSTESQCKYEFEIKDDSLFLITSDCINVDNGQSKPSFRSLVIIDNFGFSLTSYKSLPVATQFSVCSYYVRDAYLNAYLETETIPGTIVFIPDSFKGMALIALGQEDGLEEKLNEKGQRVFHLPDDGLLSLQSPARPHELAKGMIDFYLESQPDKPIRKFTTESFGKLGIMSDLEIESAGYALDSICVYCYRYNPNRDKVVNTRFGKTMGGQIKIIDVNTLRGFLKDFFPNRVAVKE